MRTQTKLVLLAYLLFLVMIAISYNLYLKNKTGCNGKYLNFQEIIQNIFGRLEEENTAEENNSTNDRKEVFNISKNIFTYDESKAVCKALGSELATYAQLMKAHKKGANWCNYGWSKKQMALYPIQKKYYDKIQKNVITKNTCGKPGVNGGYFDNKNLKFGVNCYGIRPDPNPDNIEYIIEEENNVKNELNDISKKSDVEEELIDCYKKQFKNKEIDIIPFNNSKWSRYSFKKSRYILPSKKTIDLEVLSDNKNPNTFNR